MEIHIYHNEPENFIERKESILKKETLEVNQVYKIDLQKNSSESSSLYSQIVQFEIFIRTYSYLKI